MVAPALSRNSFCRVIRRSRKNLSCAAFMYSYFGILVISASVRAFALLAIIPRCESVLAPLPEGSGRATKSR